MNREEWCEEVVRIAGINVDGIERQASGEEVPPWVGRIDEELTRRNFPIQVKRGVALVPRKAGQLIGQTYAYFGWILECLRRENSALRDKFRKGAQEWLDEDYDVEVERSIRTFLDADVVRASLRFRIALQQVFFVVVERPFSEVAEFFDGFASAISRRAKDDTFWDESYSTSAAYYVLRRDWQFVESFKNVSDLHIYLQHKLGRNAAGDLDRTRSLAKRLKLKLAPRGRPSKNWVKVRD
jgi:hypothetical protein